MQKIFLIFVVSIFFAACGSNEIVPVSFPPIVKPVERYTERGPYQVEVRSDESFEFDGVEGTTGFKLFVPNSKNPKPLVVFAHANNKDKCRLINSYNGLLGHLASYGFVIALPDHEALSCVPPNRENIENRASDLRTLKNHINAQFADFPGLDVERVIYVGHSRGGGAAVIAADNDLGAIGVVAITPINLRSYGFADLDLRPVESLNIIAGADTDLNYPYGESMEESFRGRYSSVVLHGALHTWMGDELPIRDGAEPTVTEEDQKRTVRAIVSNFLTYLNQSAASSGTFYGPDLKLGLEPILNEQISHRWVENRTGIRDQIDTVDAPLVSFDWLEIEEGEVRADYTYSSSERHRDAISLIAEPGAEISIVPPEGTRRFEFHFRGDENTTFSYRCADARDEEDESEDGPEIRSLEVINRFQQASILTSKCEEFLFEFSNERVYIDDMMFSP